VIWLTWRQQRTETLIVAFVFALAAAALVPTGLHIAAVYDDKGIAACLAHSDTCGSTLDDFTRRWDSLVNLVAWFNLVPLVVGVLLATPLVLEFERGTHRLAWTQSVTRGRWLTVRLASIGLGVLGSGLALTALMTWWRSPLDDVDSRLGEGFDFEGVMPTAYTLFAAALVIAVGVVLRRTATAIGIAVVAFFVLRIGILAWPRGHFLAPIHKTWYGSEDPDLRGAWVMSEKHGFRVAAGYSNDRSLIQSCFEKTATRSANAACLAKHHVVEFTSAVYQPASRFWLFQGIEAGIFLGLTAALVLFSVWWIRRRIS
jgi:hypothetical protein